MYSYMDAFNALEYLDSIGVVGGEAREEAIQEMADALGDQDFMEKLQYGVLGDKQRARDFDTMREIQAEEAKKAKEKAKKKVPQAAKDGPMYGPIVTQEEWDKIRNMYGSPENP
jgi:hypothetical protein